MPAVPVGGNYTGFANVAHQLETEKQGAISLDLQQASLHNRTHLDLLNLDFKKDQANVDNFLRQRGLAVSERQQDLREEQAAADMFNDMVQQSLKAKQAEMKRAQFEHEFGLDQAVKESLYGVKYDPSSRQYRNLKPGQGLFNPGDRANPWKPVDYLQDEYQRVNKGIWDRQKEIDRLTTKMTDIFMDKNSPDFKRMQVERERLATEQGQMQKQADLLGARFERYIGPMTPPMRQAQSGQFAPAGVPTTSPVEHTVLPEANEPVKIGFGDAIQDAATGAIGNVPVPANPVAKSIVSALGKAKETYTKQQLMSGSIKDYDERHLEMALESLKSSEVRDRFKKMGLSSDQWEQLIKMEIRRRRGIR